MSDKRPWGYMVMAGKPRAHAFERRVIVSGGDVLQEFLIGVCLRGIQIETMIIHSACGGGEGMYEPRSKGVM